MNFLDQAKKLAAENAGATNSVLGKLEDLVEEQTGHKYDDKIAKGGQAAQKFLGTNDGSAGQGQTVQDQTVQHDAEGQSQN